MKRYYLLAFANFLAALGGGAILSLGEDTFPHWFPKAAIVAFFVGIVIGLFFQMLTPERLSRAIAPWFSVGVGPASLALAWIFNAYADDGELRGAAAAIFFTLLSIRFGLWFFSRALRAQAAGGKEQGIALIESGYYIGMVCGLVARQSSGYTMLSALLIDAVLQPVAGLIDLAQAGGRKAPESVPAGVRAEGSPRATGAAVIPVADGRAPFDYNWYWRLTAAIVCLTIGFQGVVFSLDFQAKGKGLDTYLMACFYASVALAALFCSALKIKLDWAALDRRVVGNATICSELRRVRPKANFGLVTLLAAASMATALLAGWTWPSLVRFELTLIAVAAFIYNILVLSLLDRIGRAEKLARLNRMVKLTYLLLGVGTVLGILVMHFFIHFSPQKHVAFVVVTTACSLISFYVVRRRVVARA